MSSLEGYWENQDTEEMMRIVPYEEDEGFITYFNLKGRFAYELFEVKRSEDDITFIMSLNDDGVLYLSMQVHDNDVLSIQNEGDFQNFKRISREEFEENWDAKIVDGEPVLSYQEQHYEQFGHSDSDYINVLDLDISNDGIDEIIVHSLVEDDHIIAVYDGETNELVGYKNF